MCRWRFPYASLQTAQHTPASNLAIAAPRNATLQPEWDVRRPPHGNNCKYPIGESTFQTAILALYEQLHTFPVFLLAVCPLPSQCLTCPPSSLHILPSLCTSILNFPQPLLQPSYTFLGPHNHNHVDIIVTRCIKISSRRKFDHAIQNGNRQNVH